MSKKKQQHADGKAPAAEEITETTASPDTDTLETHEEDRETGEPPTDEPSSKEEEETSGEEPQEEKNPDEIINELRNELKNANDRYLRLMAEFDNYKKRTGREYERMVKSANEKLMLELIDVRENFERALLHGEKSTEYQHFFDGIKLIFVKFDSVLSGNDLTPFAEVGDEFDPQIHDALMKTPHDEIAEDHITEIYEKGYRLKERVIKHARVIVSAGKPDETNKNNE